MKSVIVLAILVAVAAADFYHSSQKKQTSASIEDSVESTMSSTKEVSEIPL